MGIFTPREDSLADILHIFTETRDRLTAYIGRESDKLAKTESDIADLEKDAAQSRANIDQATSTSAKLADLLS